MGSYRCRWLAKHFNAGVASLTIVKRDAEFNEVTGTLKRASDEDKSGRYQRLLAQSREGKMVH